MNNSRFFPLIFLFYGIFSTLDGVKDLRNVKLAIQVFRRMNVTLNEAIEELEMKLSEGITEYSADEMNALIE